jgi:ClpP class serine protease
MDKIIELITGATACEPRSLASFRASLMLAMKNGTMQSLEDRLQKQSEIKAVAYSLVPGQAYINTVDEYDILDPHLPENSVAVLYYEGMALPWKSYNMENRIAMCNANPRIVAILIFINTPGGYIHRIDTLSQAITASVKPTAGYVTGLCCSAGQWISSACKRVFTASDMDIHGSIGTMSTFMDDRKFWEEMGIAWTDIYATLSTKKNYVSREAESGNFEPLIAELDYLTNLFHKAISVNRNITLAPESAPFDGSDFFTETALSLKLVDQKGSLDEALNYLLVEGLKIKTRTKNN